MLRKLALLAAATVALSSPVTASAAPTGLGDFEAKFEASPGVAQMLTADAGGYVSRITANGATRSNNDWQANGSGDLNVEGQRVTYTLVAGGAASNNPRLIELGVKAAEWGLSDPVAGTDGSFPNERGGGATDPSHNLHPKSEFLDSVGHMLLALQSAPGGAAYKARAAALTDRLHRSAVWMANSADLNVLFSDKHNVNQLMFVVDALQVSASLSNDKALATKASQLMSGVLTRQLADGTWPEAGGFDIGYQLVTSELLTRYISMTDPSARAPLIAALTKGVNRWLEVVSPNGVINVVGSRTAICSTTPGSGPKGAAIDRQPLTLDYVGALTGQNLAPIAAAVDFQGQNIDHISNCGSANSDLNI